LCVVIVERMGGGGRVGGRGCNKGWGVGDKKQNKISTINFYIF